MKYTEAKKQGFVFTGCCLNNPDNKQALLHWEEALTAAAEVKTLYRDVDYVIVEDIPISCRLKVFGLMGNDLFFEIFNEYRFNKFADIIDNYERAKEKAFEEYTKKLDMLKLEFVHAKEKLEEYNKYLK